MIDPCQIMYILYNYIFNIPVSNKKTDDKIVDNNNYNSHYNDDEDEYIII